MFKKYEHLLFFFLLGYILSHYNAWVLNKKQKIETQKYVLAYEHNF